MGVDINKGMEKLGQSLDKFIKKTGEFAELAKLKHETKILQEQVEEQFTLLGKIFFDDLEQENREKEPYASICRKISQYQEKIRKVQEQMQQNERIKNSVCPNCGNEVYRNQFFCDSCGKKLY
jgi:predicted RNA-binding Zn-ribbon protein involved in translation (DUF1610 family)